MKRYHEELGNYFMPYPSIDVILSAGPSRVVTNEPGDVPRRPIGFTQPQWQRGRAVVSRSGDRWTASCFKCAQVAYCDSWDAAMNAAIAHVRVWHQGDA